MNLRIKEILKTKGNTAVWLASEIGMTQPNMSNVVNGKVMPSVETLGKIATALQVPITELFEQPQSNEVNCPNCGTRLVLNEKKNPKQ